jgi:CheY-like chemotaxis protein
VAGGYEVLAALRAQPGWQAVPVLMLTGKTEQGEAARATAAGANGYVLKPFNPVELAEQIRRVVP